MKGIYKYTLRLTTEQRLTLPVHSEILSVETQGDNIVLYAIVDNAQEGVTDYDVKIIGTGYELDNHDKNDFVGTVKLQDGRFMFHVFIRRAIR